MWKSEPYYLLYIPNPPALPHGIRQAAEQCFHACPVRCLMICCLSLLILCLFLGVFVVFITICPVWVHTTYVFCMIGSYMGSRFACSSHYEILLDLLLFYCLLSSRLTIYKKADRSFYSVWIQSVKFMSGILNLQLTTEQAVTFQVLHSERRLREFEMILDTAQISFRAVEGIICQALWDLMQQVN